MGIWRKCSFSPWLTQLVLAKKGRVCHDFTSLNKATVLDAFPIHSMPDIVSAQAGKGIWSIMDTDRGYMQIILALLCIFLTAFEMFHQMWESTRMLFGMNGAPSTFHRNMTIMMEPVLEKFSEYVNWFFDDIIVGTKKDDWGIHAEVIESIMRAAEDRGWKFGARKMHFGYNKMRLLGIIMTPQGRRPDPEKQDTLLTMRIPRTASELKSFLGLAQWFTEHIPSLSWRTTALRRMITNASSPSSKLVWKDSALQQFKYIKDQMRQPCTLAVYNPKAVVILYTDACAEGLGCILVQLQQDGTEVVVAFGSSSLSKAQERYHITRLEALAFIWTLGHFHLYLSAKPFLWRTDHRALKFIFDASKTTIPALQRYKLIADDYRFTTEWIPGTKMIADTMSRLCIIPAPGSSTMTTREMITVDLATIMPSTPPKEVSEEELDIAFYNMMDEEEILIEEEGRLDENEDGEEEGEEQRDDESESDLLNPHDQPLHPKEDDIKGKLAVDIPTYTSNERLLLAALTYLRRCILDVDSLPEGMAKELKTAVRKLAKSCTIVDRRVMKVKVRGGIREIPESFMRVKEIVKEAHDGGGHRGLDATMAVITARYWIPVLEKVVLRHIARCDTCQRFAKSHKVYAPNYTVRSYDIFKHWGIDTVGPFPPDSQGNKYAIVAVDYLTRWAEVIPSTNATASDAAHFIYNNIVCRYGVPTSIQSDNGPQFANEVIENLVRLLKIRHHFSTPYYPQANGRAERLIGTLKSMLTKSVTDTDREEDGTLNWTPALFSALYIYRSSIHSATGASPAMLVYGEELQLPIMFDPETPTNQVQHKQQIAARLQALRSFIPGLRTSQFRYSLTKEGKKILIRPTKYKIDEKVLLRTSKFDKAGHSASPFEFRYAGPYRIHKSLSKGAYVLKTIPAVEGEDGIKYFRKPINWSRLRRYIENEEDVVEV
jgi:RNase H-like domain found in reverse transcriptase/Integrase zinc binding domain/Integrase core domain/Reverse transcriptase (RNA-dependent DNA polymerase)